MGPRASKRPPNSRSACKQPPLKLKLNSARRLATQQPASAPTAEPAAEPATEPAAKPASKDEDVSTESEDSDDLNNCAASQSQYLRPESVLARRLQRMIG